MKWSHVAVASLALGIAAYAPVPSRAAVLLNVDAKDLSLTDGASVATWGSLSQATAGNQPTFSSTGMNGNPTVDFDNTSDFLLGGAITGARSVILVTRFQDGPSLATAVSNNNDSLNVRRDGTASFYRSVGHTGDNNDFYRHGNHVGQDNVYVNAVGGGGFTVDVSHVTISNAGAAANYSSFTLGRASATLGRHWGGQISEVYVLNQTLTQDEITGISSLLAEEWGSAAVSATPAQRTAGETALGIPEPSSAVAVGVVAAFGLFRRRRTPR